jgi:RNA 3'-terminal phosphate cyclase
LTVKFKPDFLDWTLIRQGLSLSLARQVPITITGGASRLGANPQFKNILNDISRTADAMGIGSPELSGNDLSFNPSGISGGSFSLDTHRDSAVSETVLFTAPLLFGRKQRTLLNLTGVTHPLVSFSTNQLQDTIFSLLEGQGLYAGAVLKRYGFPGTGEGAAEVRIYPAEKTGIIFNPRLEECEIRDGGVVFSGPFMKDAAEIREVFAGERDLGEIRVRILEVQNSAGEGFYLYLVLSVTLTGSQKEIPLVLSGAVDTGRGREHFNTECYRTLAMLKNSVRAVHEERLLPVHLVREIMIYSLFSEGIGVEKILEFYPESREIEATAELVKAFSS